MRSTLIALLLVGLVLLGAGIACDGGIDYDARATHEASSTREVELHGADVRATLAVAEVKGE